MVEGIEGAVRRQSGHRVNPLAFRDDNHQQLLPMRQDSHCASTRASAETLRPLRFPHTPIQSRRRVSNYPRWRRTGQGRHQSPPAPPYGSTWTALRAGGGFFLGRRLRPLGSAAGERRDVGLRRQRSRSNSTSRETSTLIHGMVLGTFFLLAFAGGLAGLWSLRTEYVTRSASSSVCAGSSSARPRWRSLPGRPSSRGHGSSTPGTGSPRCSPPSPQRTRKMTAPQVARRRASERRAPNAGRRWCFRRRSRRAVRFRASVGP